MKKLILFLCLAQSLAQGQDLEKLKNPKDLIKGKGLSIKGNVSANHRYYTPYQIPNRQADFQYLYSGRINFDLFGKISMPVTFSFTNQKATFGAASLRSALPVAQPFNRLSLKPKYKSHTAFLGTNAMTFSPFTLSGFRFDGVGYEYNSPKKPIYGSAMFGTLLRAVPLNTSGAYPNNKPAYKRNGFGGKIGYKKAGDKIETSLFRGVDQSNSLNRKLDSINVFPEENVALSIGFSKVIKEKITLKSDIGRSQIFRQAQNDLYFANQVGSLFRQMKNRKFRQAIKTGLDYKDEKWMIGFEYSRVDPQYKTQGGYFFNNDLETFALKSQKKFLKDKLDLTADVGKQKSNLDLSRPQTSDRWVWNVGANYAPSERLSLNMNYSTFATFSNFINQFQYLKAIDPFQEIDTLNYRQINQNLNFGLNYLLPSKNKKIKNTVSTNFLYQNGVDEQGRSRNSNDLLNISLNFGQNFETSQLMYSLGMNLVENQLVTTNDKLWGPNINVSYPIIKNKLIFTGNGNYNFSTNRNFQTQIDKKRSVFVGNLSLASTIKKAHKLTVNALFLKTSNPNFKALVGENFAERTFNIGYTYNFKVLDLKIK